MIKRVSASEVERLRATIALLDGPDAEHPDRAEFAAAARTICAMLASRFPGGTVELRVPPYAAVQLGIGERGRHTRGTPPNVVQTDAATLIGLATGQLAWSQARADHLVQASGILAEVEQLWPLPELT